MLREYAAGLSQLGVEQPRYDEFVSPDGSLRAPWKPLAELATNFTEPELGRVNEEIVRLLADDGVSYSRPGQRPAPWGLDPFPLLLDAGTWTPLEVGLAQRAELLNAILIDLYGEQRLLADGVLPAAAVFAHPGFVRVVGRRSTRDPRPLVLCATDLGRDTDGTWRVLGDRAQAPSGIGYAMENRRVVSRVLPELYREAGLHRIEPFIAALRSALVQSADGDQSDPRVVVLSPGPQSETAYDQAHLASALGFPLVQGSDLVVRNGWVYLRAPGRGAPRLERVDVILRRVDAAWSDPLELRGDSQLGVAGLTEAVRRGRVRVVNGLGAGILENPALMPYMESMCQALLGEPLRLPSIESWWCGEPDGLERVLDQTDTLLVRAIDGPVAALADLDVDEIRQRVLAAPTRYVGQRRMQLSQAPTWQAGARGRVRPLPITLRTFTLRYGSVYRPMIGGLGSILDGSKSLGSKDVWVTKAAPSDPDQGLVDVLPMTNTRAATVTVPRVLDDLYWYGRYAERTEDLLRTILAAHGLAEDFRTRPRTSGGTSLEIMLGALNRLAGKEFEDLDDEFRALLSDHDRVGSAAHSIAALRASLAGIRDQLSLDTWRAFGATDRAMVALRESNHSWQIGEIAGRMLTGILSLQGVEASMIRDEGWRMICLGRALERSLQVCHLLAATTTVRRGIDVDRSVLTAVLTAAESAVTHRRRYRGYVRTGGVLELLITDEENPRSLAFNLAEVVAHLDKLPLSTGSTRPERLAADLRERVAETDIATLVAIGGEGRPNLEAFLLQTVDHLLRLGTVITELHLDTGPAPRAMQSFQLEASR